MILGVSVGSFFLVFSSFAKLGYHLFGVPNFVFSSFKLLHCMSVVPHIMNLMVFFGCRYHDFTNYGQKKELNDQ